jgi:hypothetical protein
MRACRTREIEQLSRHRLIQINKLRSRTIAPPNLDRSADCRGLIREQIVDVDGSLHPAFLQLSMHDDRGAVAA